MRVRYKNGNLEIYLNQRGSNYITLVEGVNEDVAENILADIEAQDLTEIEELKDVIEILLCHLGVSNERRNIKLPNKVN